MNKEKSVMAVVFYKNQILSTNEIIYGNVKTSLPKGHIEENETLIETAIRETFEETNEVLTISEFKKELSPYIISFKNHHDEEISKEIIPLLFIVTKKDNIIPKEKRIISVSYIDVF